MNNKILPTKVEGWGRRTPRPRNAQSVVMALLLSLLGAADGGAQTSLIVSSLGNPVATPTIFAFGPVAGSSSFQTGPQAWKLASVTVLLTWGAAGLTNIFPANVRLLADGGGTPGALLADLGWLPVTNHDQSSFVRYTFSPLSAVMLNPSTTYWVAVGAGTNGFVSVGRDFNPSTFEYVGAPGTSMAVNYYGQGAPSDPGSSGDGFVLLFEVDGTAVVAAPWLQVMPAGRGVILSWPLSATNFDLETSNTLSPGASWTVVTNGIVAAGNGFVLTNNADAPAAFFRLHGRSL